LDTCIWYAEAYAASQSSFTRLSFWLEPRSICIHCGSEKALDHRVAMLPSTAYCAARVADSTGDEVVGLPFEISGPQVGGPVGPDGPVSDGLSPVPTGGAGALAGPV
jgi:hypothetical protein